MTRGGFEIAARLADGAQAGALREVGAGAAVTSLAGIDFAHHAAGSAEPDSAGAVEWTLEWTAPRRAAGPVVLHFAGTAADGDQSQFGDHVYSDSATVPAAHAR